MNNSSIQNELSQRWIAQSGLANGDVFLLHSDIRRFLLNSKRKKNVRYFNNYK